jgi:alpha-galactosidase
VQDLTVRAALQGGREHVYHAAMLDRHASSVLSLDEISAVVTDLIEAHGDALPEGVRSSGSGDPQRTKTPLKGATRAARAR